MRGVRVHRTALRCTRIHGFRAAAIFYPNFYPKRQRGGSPTRRTSALGASGPSALTRAAGCPHVIHRALASQVKLVWDGRGPAVPADEPGGGDHGEDDEQDSACDQITGYGGLGTVTRELDSGLGVSFGQSAYQVDLCQPRSVWQPFAEDYFHRFGLAGGDGDVVVNLERSGGEAARAVGELQVAADVEGPAAGVVDMRYDNGLAVGGPGRGKAM